MTIILSLGVFAILGGVIILYILPTLVDIIEPIVSMIFGFFIMFMLIIFICAGVVWCILAFIMSVFGIQNIGPWHG